MAAPDRDLLTARLMALAPGLPARSAQVVASLLCARGGVLTHNGLAEAVFDLSAVRLTRDGLATAVKHARRVLRGRVTITTLCGVGYAAAAVDPQIAALLDPDA
jgi:DNA-binding winged helix-turn-helix (wHTH) protein